MNPIEILIYAAAYDVFNRATKAPYNPIKYDILDAAVRILNLYYICL